jgi:protein TonB
MSEFFFAYGMVYQTFSAKKFKFMKTDRFSSMDDIIFEKRNKRYGAYELRTRYHKRLFKSFLIASVVSVTLIVISHITRTIEGTEIIPKFTDSAIFVTPPITVETFEKPMHSQQTLPPPTHPDQYAFVPINDTTVVERVDTNALASTTPNITFNAVGEKSTGTDTNAVGNIPGKPKIYNGAMVDMMPEFPGGIEKFYSYLMKSIRYTSMARENGVKGKVYVKFVVDEAGLITNVKILRGIGYGLDEAVINVLAGSPKWNPGSVRNSAVKTEMVLPVNFNLK